MDKGVSSKKLIAHSQRCLWLVVGWGSVGRAGRAGRAAAAFSPNMDWDSGDG